MSKFKLFFIVALLFAAISSSAQTYVRISQSGDAENPNNIQINCDEAVSEAQTTVYFTDDGGNTGNHTTQSYDRTLLSTNAGSLNVRFTAFSLGAGATLTIKDAITQVVLVSNATTTTLNGRTISSPRGGLQFIFNGGNAGGTGWVAKVWCGTLCPNLATTISVAGVTATTEQGTGNQFFDICQNRDIVFNTDSRIDNAPTNEVATYNWAVISQYDTIWYNDAGPTLTRSFVEEGGYYVMCDAITNGGCYNRNINKTAVRVSLTPAWDQVHFGPDSICPGTQVTFDGQPTPPDWSMEIPEIVSGATFLPDGNSTCYNTDLEFDIFDADARITSINDIEKIYMKMEHSYLGDLSILIRCPNGNQCLLKAKDATTATMAGLRWTGSGNNNANSKGGGNKHLGLAPDPGTSDDCYLTAGEGWPYYFYPNGNTPMGDNSPTISVNYTDPCGNSSFGANSVVDSSRQYAPYQSMASLNGCPLNGTWTLYVCDHLNQDNGWIFEWGLYFRDDLYPDNLWAYGNTYSNTTYEWQGENIQPHQGQPGVQTARVQNSNPDNMETRPYTFYATDNFGCTYDTTVMVHVRASRDPQCCIEPILHLTAGSNQPCGNTTTLSAGDFNHEGNTGRWTASGPGTATFSQAESPVTEVTVSAYGDYVFYWDEYYQGNRTCTSRDSVLVNFAQIMDALLAEIPACCRSANTIILEAPNFGTLTCTGPTNTAFNADARTFSPINATPGNYTITNTVDGRCVSNSPSSRTFTIFDELQVRGGYANGAFESCVATGMDPQVGVSLIISGVAQNTPPEYSITGAYTENESEETVSTGNLSVPNLTSGTWTQTFSSPLEYSFVVSDTRGCSSVPVAGYFACDCPNYAGTFASLAPTIACGTDAIEIGHNSDYTLDNTGGVFSYVVCTNPSDVRNTILPNGTLSGTTTQLTLGAFGGSYDTQYYLVAVAGYGSGGAAFGSGCRSLSQPKPIMWKKVPTPTVTPAYTCGRTITLLGSQPAEGESGYWEVVNAPEGYTYTPINNTTNNMHNAQVLSSQNGQITFRWNVQSSICVGYGQATYNFKAIPRPGAGVDKTVCGNSTTLSGSRSLETSTLQWTMNGGIISPADNLTPLVTANGSGTFPITLTERNEECLGSDVVEVTFVSIPQPTVTDEVDTVCGVTAELIVYNTSPEHDGRWTVYDEDPTLNPNARPIDVSGFRLYGNPSAPSRDGYPHCFVTITFPQSQVEIERWFVWTEPINNPNLPQDLECFGRAVKKVVFRKLPVISARQCGGEGNTVNVCGREVCLSADTTSAASFTTFEWISKDVAGRFQNASHATTSFILDSTETISGYLDVDLFITARNASCTAIDTMHVRFLQRPVANAGLDYAVCGLEYTLNGSWGIPPSDTYVPTCRWSVVSGPGASVSWLSNVPDSIVEVVRPNGYGIYTFQVNEFNTSGAANECFDLDTVVVEFLQQPIASAGVDFNVCGNDFQLNALPVGAHLGDSVYGEWACIDGEALFDNINDPHTNGHFSHDGSVRFQWIVTNHPTLPNVDARSCSAMDEVQVTFYKIPNPSLQMNQQDTIWCGLYFPRLHADSSATGVSGLWFEENPSTQFGPQNSTQSSILTDVTVSSYGQHTFYWMEYTGPEDNPRFCRDTSEGWTIDFRQNPSATILIDDTVQFCALDGQIPVDFNGIGTGTWSANPGGSVFFDDINSPTTRIWTDTYNSDEIGYPTYEVYWSVVDAICSDRDTIKVIFARVPSDSIKIIPPKCFGEPAIVTAAEDTLPRYDWDFGNGIVDTTHLNNANGEFRVLVYWDDRQETHNVGLTTQTSQGCISNIGSAVVVEPTLPQYNYNIIMDTCALGKGGIEFLDTSGYFAFFWIDTTVGPVIANPYMGYAITDYSIYELPQGRYTYRSDYRTFNTEYITQYNTYLGEAYCHEFPEFEVGTIGMIEAEFAVSAEVVLANLVAPDAKVIFVNSTNYDNVGKRCEWHYGDGTIEKKCDEYVEHVYAEPGCYEPYLIVMNRDLQECRDTAFLDECVFIDKASKVEVPNIFSPNGDGVNDYFQVSAETLKEFHGSIINRYGRQVFEWTDWLNEDAGWDGKLNGSTDGTPGVYFYIIKAVGYDGVEYELEGSLHLVK